MIDLREIQQQIGEWGKYNFPDATPEMCVLGIAEETGELAHAFLKRKQGIRGETTKHEQEAVDAIGDLAVFMLHLCVMMGWDFEEIVTETWETVKQRDWQSDPDNGKIEDS